MPLLGPTSYPQTLESFLGHWEEVNKRLGVGHPLVLPDGLDLAGGQALLAEVEALSFAAADALQDQVIARTGWQLTRNALRARLAQFSDLVRAYWHSTPWAQLVGHLPQAQASAERFLQPCREAQRLWTLLEAETPPPGAPNPIFLDPGGQYGLADFTAHIAKATADALALEAAIWNRSVALARRNAVMNKVKTELMAYNRAVTGRLPPGDALLSIMPALWPAPGHTPEPVELTGAWDSAANAARFTWSASEDKLLSHYELRVCAGADYNTDDERSVKRIAKDAPREAVTNLLLTQPAAAACFRLYVVLETANEKGSNTSVIQRP